MNVVLLGSGNVATHLGLALKAAGHDILQVWSRVNDHASELAEKLSARPVSGELQSLSNAGDIYIMAVSDEVIPVLASRFPFKDKLLVHTSGTTDMAALSEGSLSAGVLYPLQTFSKQKKVNFRNIPVAIEGSSAGITGVLHSLAESISDNVFFLDSQKRLMLHMAAVFACNFSNHLYTIAEEILAKQGLGFDLIRPLIAETAEKVQSFSPSEVQTGPAVRNDEITVHKHLEALKDAAELRHIYEILSQSIKKFYPGQ